MWWNPQETVDLVTFTGEILNGKDHFLWYFWFLIGSFVSLFIVQNIEISPISSCENFVKMHSFRRVSGGSLEILQKLFISTNFPYQKMRWNFSILRSVYYAFYKYFLI